MSVSRRGFIAGCSAFVAGFAGTRFNTLAFADPGSEGEILVTVFLRGGIDSLSLVVPRDGADRGHYETARPMLAVPLTGTNAVLPLTAQFGFNPRTNTWPSGTPTPPATLYDLFLQNNLSLVVAAGMHEDNRSHFDSMSFMELGTPGQLSTPSGWLTRHLATSTTVSPEAVMPSLAVGNLQQASLRGSLETLNMTSPDSFSLAVGPSTWRNAARYALRNLWSSQPSWLHQSGVAALDAIDIIELASPGTYTPANGAVYPDTTLGNHFRTIARMIKLNLGLQVATIDYGGWDTHNGQGDGGSGYFGGRVEELSTALAAFYVDLDGAGAADYTKRLTVVVQSEFGRRLRENADRGTDHGHGGVMMVLSGNAIGGVHGTWPGLAPGQLYDGADLAVGTDYRRVLAEVLVRRCGNAALDDIFPGYSGYAPLGIVQGPDVPPEPVFCDGFEDGTAGAWSGSTP